MIHSNDGKWGAPLPALPVAPEEWYLVLVSVGFVLFEPLGPFAPS